jgi:hypothetical protein
MINIPVNAMECVLPPATDITLFLCVDNLTGSNTSSVLLPHALPYPQAYISPDSIMRVILLQECETIVVKEKFVITHRKSVLTHRK